MNKIELYYTMNEIYCFEIEKKYDCQPRRKLFSDTAAAGQQKLKK